MDWESRGEKVMAETRGVVFRMETNRVGYTW